MCMIFFCCRKAKKEKTRPTTKSERPKSPQPPKSLPKISEGKKKLPSKTPVRMVKRSKSPQKKEQKKTEDKRKKRKKQIKKPKPVETAITLKSSTPTSDSLLLSKKVSEAHFEHISLKENATFKMLNVGEIDTKRGKEKFNYDGHLYIFDKLNSDGTVKFWRCELKNGGIDKCKGRIWTTMENNFIRLVTPQRVSIIQLELWPNK
uniref:FLYWCH-type domain-containing protein n=1 Tax=Meloidogyne hapla TaxID=6305 RepID=A0A1I8B955_MELHA